MPMTSILAMGMVGQLGWCFFACCALWLGWTFTRKRLTSWLKRLWSIRSRNRGWGKSAPIWFSLFCVVGLIYGGTLLPQPTVVTEHHVAILAKLDNGDFAYRSDEKPQGDTYRPCAIDREAGIDVDGILTQAIGYVAEHATWQEQGVCRSILKPEWAFWFKDEANNFQYERIKN